MSKKIYKKSSRPEPKLAPIEIQKLWQANFLMYNEIMVNNNIRFCREMGLDVQIKYENGKFTFTASDPSKPRRKHFYECRDDKRHRQILSRLSSLYKV